MNSPATQRPGRTFELKVLIVALLVVSLASWLRLRLAILDWQILPELGAAASPIYLAVSAGVWGLASLAAAAGLYFRRRWAPRFTHITCAALAAWYWLERLTLNPSPQAQQNWPFTLGFTVIALIFAFATLALNAQKEYFES